MAHNKRSTICCAVLSCKNTQSNSPEKKFISIPKGAKRLVWLEAINRSDSGLSFESTLRICEDHFDVSGVFKTLIRNLVLTLYFLLKVEKDFKKNSARWTTVGNVVPHKNLFHSAPVEEGLSFENVLFVTILISSY